MMNQTCDLLAEALVYPAPGQLEKLLNGLNNLPSGPVKNALDAFLRDIARLDLGQWEELHTRTLDLNPPAAPYIGYQIWGESYQRGAFLSKLNRALWESRVDTGGELPDHLLPVLRYLSAVSSPLPELMEVLEPAVRRMQEALRKAEAQNPFIYLLEAITLAFAEVKWKQAKVKEPEGAALLTSGSLLSGGSI